MIYLQIKISNPYQFGKLETLMLDWIVRLETGKYYGSGKN